MNPMMAKRLLPCAGLLLAGLLAACGGELEPPMGPGGGGGGGGDPSSPSCDDDCAGAEEALPPAPALDPVAQETSWSTLAISGKARAKLLGTVVVTGGLEPEVSTRAGEDGRFCIEVALLPDAEQQLEVREVDAQGRSGPPGLLRVVHVSPPPPVEVAPQLAEPENMALGRSLGLRGDVVGGSPANVTDGIAETTMDLRFRDAEFLGIGGSYGYVWAGIFDEVEVERLRVRWADEAGDGTRYAKDYDLLVTDLLEPPLPSPGGDGWTKLWEVRGGDGGVDELALEPTIHVRHVALILWENADTGVDETFSLAEIEVLAPAELIAPPVQQEPVPPPGCGT